MSSGDRRTPCFVALESVALSRVASASAWLAVGVVWLVSGFVLLFYPLGFGSNGHDTNTTLPAIAPGVGSQSDNGNPGLQVPARCAAAGPRGLEWPPVVPCQGP